VSASSLRRQDRDQLVRRIVFLGVLVVFILGMVPELLTLIIEGRVVILIAAPVASVMAVIIGRPMPKRFFKLLFSKWFFLSYFALGLIHFIGFPFVVKYGAWNESLVVTTALMTGTDPYSLKEPLQSHSFIWILAWVLHVATWLLIPALISIVITDAKEDIKKDQSLRRRLRAWLLASGVPEAKLAAATDEQFRTIEKWLNEQERKDTRHE
jgi:hypothetical protein